MDTSNLIDFNISPVVNVATHLNPETINSLSPGNNPFDDVVKSGNILKNTPTSSIFLSTTLNNSSSHLFKIPSTTLDSSFKTLSTSFDIGRESIPFNLREIDDLDFSRPSLGTSNFDIGKESLGILHIKSPDLNFGLTTELTEPVLLLNGNDCEIDDGCKSPSLTTNDFNTAFLAPHNSKESVSSTSSVSSFNPSYNSKSFINTDISKIYSLPSLSSTNNFESSSLMRSNKLNEAFINTSELLRNFKLSTKSSISSIQSPLCDNPSGMLGSRLATPELDEFRTRILSLPVPLKLENKFDILNNSEVNCKGVVKLNGQRFWSAEKMKQKTKHLRRSFCGTLNFDEEEGDANFNDSVFIEANYIASKIADGSIAEAGPTDNLLDNTSPPELCDDPVDEEANKETVKSDTRTVFKTIDKLLAPIPDPNLHFSTKLANKSGNNSNNSANNISKISNKSANANRLSQNSNLADSSNDVEGSKKDNISKSSDTKDIL